MLNSISTAGQLTQPRGIVTINDIQLPWINFEVENNNYYMADTFHVLMSLTEMPPEYDVTYWKTIISIYINIYAGFPPDITNYSPNNLQNLIYGRVDDITIDRKTRMISLTGRNLLAEFLDNKTTKKYQNSVSSEVAIELATSHGLTPIVTETDTPVGVYYENNYSKLTSEQSEWDLLTFLAQQEGFNCFVKGKNFYFQPKTPLTAKPYVINYDPEDFDAPYPISNCQELRFNRNLTLAKGLSVTVRGWNSDENQPFQTTVRSRLRPGRPVGNYQKYEYRQDGLSPEQILQYANQKYKELSQHENKYSIELPADDILTVENVIQIIDNEDGTKDVFYPDSITRRMDFNTGYTMNITVKNHPTESEVLI